MALPTRYQRVVTATNYDTVGFNVYLAFGGTQAMSTGSIDFTATDAVSVFAGLTKLSDAAQAAVAELSATIASNNGTFLLSAPAGASPSYNFSSKGTTQANNTAQQFPAPITSIVTAQSDISDARNNIRVGGIDSGTNLATQGTGSFGNFALNIGARNNGASLPFTGRLYGNIIRGAQSTQAEVSATEAWLNARTGAPLVVQANQASFTWAGTSSPNSTTYLGTRYVTPVHEGMRRCLLLDNGTVNYYLDPNDSTKKADGTAATLTGADGQVMVEIPAFYTRRTVVGGATTWEVSATPASGFALHPAFTKDGVDVPFRYIGAYDACVFDDSASAYISGLNWSNNISPNGVAVDSAADKLASVSGVFPMVGLARAENRTIAANRGSGWRQLDYTLWSAVQLLYLVEYQTFFSQNVLGAGNTATSYASASGTQSDNGGSEAGKSNGIGNASTNTTNGASSASRGVAWMSYRGIENFYGNEWTWVDGVIVNPDGSVSADQGDWWFTNNSADFSDTVRTNMTQITAAAATGSGVWMTSLVNANNFFVPAASSGGSSTTFITDQFFNSTSADRVVMVGGSADNGALAGAFDVDAGSVTPGSRSRGVGARLAF